MTPEEQNELDTLKRLLADAKGRIKAIELDNFEIKRNAKLATDQAEAYKAETDAALVTASEQMKTAHAIGCGIFGMACLGRSFMSRKITASRMVHRETEQVKLLQSFVEATAKNDPTALKTCSDQAKQKIATIKNDAEVNRSKAFELALAWGFKNFEETFNKLVKEG
jgi:hypothetical protein